MYCVCVAEQKLLVFAIWMGPREGPLHTDMLKASRLLVYKDLLIKLSVFWNICVSDN
jgi:hypothetical protein